MHIVLANRWFPPESGWGGVAMYNYALAHALVALGNQVSVITSRLSPDLPAETQVDGIHIRRILVRDVYPWRAMPVIGPYVTIAQQFLYSRRVNQALIDLCARQPIDVVEFADVNAEGFDFARKPKAAFVVRCHTPTFVLAKYYKGHEMTTENRLMARREKTMIRAAHALTAPSRDMTSVIAKECNVSADSFTVIPNALRMNDFKPAPSQPSASINVLHVGRLDRAKGVVTLAQAIPQVVNTMPNVRFIFAGEDRRTASGTMQRAELEIFLRDQGVLSQVDFLGEVEQTQLMELYQRADICVVPSMLYESFSYTTAQAMAMGKPVVASRIGGIPETLDDGISGILVTPGNVAELGEAILRLAQDAALREKLGCAGYAKAAREFDALRVAQHTLKVYERAIANFRPSKR